MARTVNDVIKNARTDVFINSWKLLQHKVSRFMISRERGLSLSFRFLKELIRLSPSEKASLSFQSEVPGFYLEIQLKSFPLSTNTFIACAQRLAN
jgi:hypothetical protein